MCGTAVPTWVVRCLKKSSFSFFFRLEFDLKIKLDASGLAWFDLPHTLMIVALTYPSNTICHTSTQPLADRIEARSTPGIVVVR